MCANKYTYKPQYNVNIMNAINIKSRQADWSQFRVKYVDIEKNLLYNVQSLNPFLSHSFPTPPPLFLSLLSIIFFLEEKKPETKR